MNYFDLHCDTPYECYTKNQRFYVNQLSVSGELAKDFCEWKQVFAVWIKDEMDDPFDFYKKVLNDFKEKLKEIEDITINTDDEGILVKADTLGSLEAIVQLLKELNIVFPYTLP